MSSRSSRVGDLQALLELGRVEQLARRPGLDEDGRERDEPGEALGADRGVALAAAARAVRVGLGVGQLARVGRRRPAPGRRRRGARRASRRARRPRRSSSGGPRTCTCSPRRSTQRREHARRWRTGSRRRSSRRRRDGPRRSGRSGARPARRCARTRAPRRCPASRRTATRRGWRSRAGRILARRAAEVVLGLRRVRDLAADARQAEDAQRAALVGVAEEVELPALEEQVVRVDLAGARLVALHRVVVEE